MSAEFAEFLKMGGRLGFLLLAVYLLYIVGPQVPDVRSDESGVHYTFPAN